MHPIEHLRSLARAGDLPAEWLIPESAEALEGLIGDRNALVMGCRKLLEHHAVCGPMWWLCGQVLTARDPRRALDRLVEVFLDDPTSLHLSLALADVDGDGPDAPRIVEASLAAAGGVVPVQPFDPRDFATTSAGVSGAVWVVAPLGTVVPDEIFAAVTRSPDATDPEVTTHQLTVRRPRPVEVLAVEAIDLVIRPDGIAGATVLGTSPDVAFVPELLARG